MSETENRANVETAVNHLNDVEAVKHSSATVDMERDGESEVEMIAWLEPDAYVSQMVETVENDGFKVKAVEKNDHDRLVVRFEPATDY